MKIDVKKTVLLIILVVILLSSFLIYYFIFKGELIIKNYDKKCNCIKEIINYNSEYKNKEIDIKYGNKILGYKKINNIIQESNIVVDTSKIGQYKLQYKIKYKNKVKNISKIVEVKDIEAPKIEVDENTILNVCPDNKSFNLEYKATDNYDGDITDKVTKEIKPDILVLKVVDSSGNETIKKLKIKYDDSEKPIIKLNGSKEIKLVVNERYKELKATATDNCDGDITDRIRIDSNVNTNKAGEYYVKYNVKDKLNNEETVIRKVIVYPKNNGDNKGSVIYLTFDDGPYKYTNKLLDILKKYDVKATFFVTNQYPSYQNIIKREYMEGHAVGIHTYNHNYSYIYKNKDNYFNDLNKMNEIIKKQTGSYSNLVRFPGGSSNTVSKKYSLGIMTSLAIELTNKNYYYFDWNVSSGDAGQTKDTTRIVNNVVKKMDGRTLVVLQHDIKEYSVDAVEEIIRKGLEKGYTFKKLDENSFSAHQIILN